MASFKETGIEENILKAIEELGFESPMPIQEKVIPHLLKENCEDIVALAQTGTGKTAAFGLPLIQKTDLSKKYVQHLILSPTRELCVQIANDLTDFSKYIKGFKVTAVFGGASIENQIKAIKKGTQIISATPGRLLDLLNRGVIDISKIKTVVLDEADEMLNMGFRDDLEDILKTTPKEKNTLLFSATMPNEVLTIANRYMKNPIELSVGQRNAGAEKVNHICFMVHAKDRYLALKRIADYYPEIYGIIFCRTRKETQEIADSLIRDGYNADALHGDLSQIQRDTVMNKFRIRHLRLLVATDVAARGLDVDNISHVINYNLPDDNEVYTHRSGRTGRAGKTGTSIVIANLKEKSKLHDIERQVKKKFEYKPVPLGKEICEKQLIHLIDRMKNVEVDHKQIDDFLPAVYEKLETLEREELIQKFVSLEFNRFLDYYKNTADLNVPEKSRGEKPDRRERSGRDGGEEFTRFFINLGKTDDLKPTNIIGMVNDYTGVRNINIGAIEILKNFSFFEADANYTKQILKGFEGKAFKQRPINVEISEKRKTENRKPSGGSGDRRGGERRGGGKPSFNKRKSGGGKTFEGKSKRRRY